VILCARVLPSASCGAAWLYHVPAVVADVLGLSPGKVRGHEELEMWRHSRVTTLYAQP
jgi:hypothetical protein